MIWGCFGGRNSSLITDQICSKLFLLLHILNVIPHYKRDVKIYVSHEALYQGQMYAFIALMNYNIPELWYCGDSVMMLGGMKFLSKNPFSL